MKRIVFLAAVTTVMGVVIAAPPAAAAAPNRSAAPASITADVAAYENDTAVPSGDPAQTGIACNQEYNAQGNYAAEVCFNLYGDQIWVYDARGDGLAAHGQWANYLRNASGDWVLYREGDCKNSLGHGHWGMCNKEFYEDSTNPNAKNGQGSGLRLWACTDQSCNGDYTWVRNNG